MKKILIALLAFTSFVLHAKEIEAIVLTTGDNVKVGFVLSETFSMRFKENVLELNDSNSSISYPLVDIMSICYLSQDDLDSSSVDEVINRESAIFMQVQYDCLVIKNAVNKIVKVYTPNGNLMKEFLVKDNEYKLSLSEFPKGISIVNCNHQSIKVQLK